MSRTTLTDSEVMYMYLYNPLVWQVHPATMNPQAQVVQSIDFDQEGEEIMTADGRLYDRGGGSFDHPSRIFFTEQEAKDFCYQNT